MATTAADYLVLHGAPHSMEHMLGLTTGCGETGRKSCATRVLLHQSSLTKSLWWSQLQHGGIP